MYGYGVDGEFEKIRTAAKDHPCVQPGCVIHKGERYADSVLAPWVGVQDDPDYPPSPLGEWQRTRTHLAGTPHNEDGMIDLYHRTDEFAAELIRHTGRMISKENNRRIYFSNRRDGQTAGYGDSVIHIRIPLTWAELDDEFPDGERHYAVLDTRVRPIWED